MSYQYYVEHALSLGRNRGVIDPECAMLQKLPEEGRADEVGHLRKQVLRLLDPSNWGDDDPKPNMTSFGALLEAMPRLDLPGKPMLALNNAGWFVARWESTGSTITLEFAPDGAVHGEGRAKP